MLALISLCSVGYMLIFGVFAFRDYSIIFDGGLRIWHGQIPYRDFFLPLGPMVFYLQAFFDLLAGPNIRAMQLHAGVINAIVLCLFFLYARRNIPTWIALVLTGVLHFCYYGATVNPWYNHTALFFYFIGQVALWNALDDDEFVPVSCLIFSGVCAALAVFSKQDIGGLAAVFMGSQLLFFGRRPLKESMIYAGSGLLTAGILVAYFQMHGDFGYWFNYGQPPHNIREDRLAGLLDKDVLKHDVRWNMLLAVPLIFLCLQDYRKSAWWRFFKILGLIGMSIVIGQTSGQPEWTVYFFLPWGALFLIELISDNPRLELNSSARRAICLLVGWIVFIYGTSIFPFHAVKAYFSRALTPLPSGVYARMRYKPEVADGIEKIRKELRLHPGAPGTSWFLNMSEYSFIYADLNVQPPRQTHLWYHTHVTLFDKDYAAFKERLRRKEFDYILLQEMASGTPPPEFRGYLESLGYRPVLIVPTPKSERGSLYDLSVYKRQL